MDDLLAFLTRNCCQGSGDCLPRTRAADSIAKRRGSLQKTASRPGTP